MLITPRIYDDIIILALEGEFETDEDADLLLTHINTILATSRKQDVKKIAIGLLDCPSISEYGFETLFWAYERVKSRGGKLKLLRPNKQIFNQLADDRFFTKFEIYYDESSLVVSFLLDGPFIDKPDH